MSYSKEYYQVNIEKIREKNKKWYDANREKMQIYRDANKEKKKQYNSEYRSNNNDSLIDYDKQRNNSEKRKRGRYFFRYKCAIEENWTHYQSTSKCECCGALLLEGKRGNQLKCQDHDHISGQIRGVICNSCNQIEGLIRNNEHRMALNSYLEKYGK